MGIARLKNNAIGATLVFLHTSNDVYIYIYRSLGEQNRRFPLTGIQAQHPAPAPHASHARRDRSMARSRLVARPNLGGLHSSVSRSRKSVQKLARVVGPLSFISHSENNGFVQGMDSLCSGHIIKYWFCEFMIVRYLKMSMKPKEAQSFCNFFLWSWRVNVRVTL